jgi:hypothetical protein
VPVPLAGEVARQLPSNQAAAAIGISAMRMIALFVSGSTAVLNGKYSGNMATATRQHASTTPSAIRTAKSDCSI